MLSLIPLLCAFSTPPELLKTTEHDLYEVWSLDYSRVLGSESDLSRGSDLADFRQAVSRHVTPDPLVLLRRQRGVYARYLPRELPYFDRLLEGRAGRIRGMSCLESLLLEEHLRHAGSGRWDAEFAAYVLVRGESLLVYFVSGHDISPPTSEPLLERIRKKVSEGWQLLSLLHNHPFWFANEVDIGGTTIPSAPDADTFVGLHESLGLRQAWITNGFSTLVLEAAEFQKFVRGTPEPAPLTYFSSSSGN